MKRHWPLMVVIGAIVLFVLFMILCPPNAPAGEIHGNVEAGYDWENNICFTELRVEYHYFLWIDHIVYGGTKVLFDSDFIYNYPFKDIYNLGQRSYITENVFVQIDLICSHAVLHRANEIQDRVVLCERTYAIVRTISVGYRW